MTKTMTSVFALGALTAGTATADPAWDLIAAIEVEEIMTETTYEVRKTFPAAVQNGIEDFDITGYLVPLANGAELSDFILISDMGFCPFCGSPEHGTSLQVSMASPVAFEEGARVTVRGALEANTDPETFQSTMLRGAVLVDG